MCLPLCSHHQGIILEDFCYSICSYFPFPSPPSCQGEWRHQAPFRLRICPFWMFLIWIGSCNTGPWVTGFRYRLNVCATCLPSLKFIQWNKIPTLTVFGGGRWLGHESEALMNAIGALINDTPEGYLVPSNMWGHAKRTEDSWQWTRKQTLSCPDLGLTASWAVRNECLLFKPPVLECSVTSVVSDSLQPCGLYPARFLCPWDSLGKNTRVGCHAHLKGIFPTQGSNQPGSLASAGRLFITSATWEAQIFLLIF